MLTSIIFQGLIIGILVSIPMGPIGVMCIQRTLHQGRTSGLVSGIGAATADSAFAAIAGFGLTFISDFFKDHQKTIMILGALVLMFFGFKLFFTNAINQVRRQKLNKTNYFTDFISVFFLTLSNPITIIFFGVMFAGLGVVKDDTSQVGVLIGGIFLGAIGYWLLLSSLVNYFRKYFRLRIIFWINKIAGILIVLFGVAAGINAFFPQFSEESLGNSKIIEITSGLNDSVK